MSRLKLPQLDFLNFFVKKNGEMLRVFWIFLFDFLSLSWYCSVGRCVIPWEFLGKSVKHTFSCRKMYPV